MKIRWSRAVLPVSIMATLLAFACSGSDPTPTPTPTTVPTPTAPNENELAYFEEVRSARTLTEENFENFSSIFGSIYPTRGALIQALENAGVGTAFDATLEELEQISPPPKYEADHQSLVSGTRQLSELDKDAAEAVRKGDLVTFSLVNGEMARSTSSMMDGLSPSYCSRLSIPGGQEVPGCRPVDPLPAGSYGIELSQTLRNFASSLFTGGASTAFALSLTPTEIAEVAEREFPLLIGAFSEYATQIRDLQPPEEMAEDHQRLVDFFNEGPGLPEQDTGSDSPEPLDPLEVRAAQDQLFDRLIQLSKDVTNEDFRLISAPILLPFAEAIE